MISPERRIVILDVDTGIDDAWSLIYALRSAKLHVLGITTVFGNASIDITTRNTLAMVELLEKHTPVFRGADRPLLRPWDGPVPSYHGFNGLGDAPLPPTSRRAETLEATQFIREAIHAHPHQVTIITVARLTNLARALLYDPALAPLIGEVVIMGGAAFCPGNVSAVAEANIWGDPEAADIVFQSAVPITMVGLDVTMQARLTRSDLARLNPDLPYASLMKAATEFYISAYEQDTPAIKDWCPIHDPLAVAVAEDASLVETRLLPVRVETRGQFTDGMTVVDARDGATAPKSVKVAVSLHAARFLEEFRTRVGMVR